MTNEKVSIDANQLERCAVVAHLKEPDRNPLTKADFQAYAADSDWQQLADNARALASFIETLK